MTPVSARLDRLDRHMTDYEALMWNIDADPWLCANMVGINLLDRPLDFEDFRLRIANAAAQIPRLRQRVQPSLGGLTPPVWVTDPEFELDHHLRRMALPEPGSLRQLLDVAAELMQDPLDRTRPLWQLTVFDGLEGHRSALFSKLHHTIGDATTAIEIAAHYLSPTPDPPLPEPVDLDALVRSEAAPVCGAISQLLDAGSELARRGVGALWGAAGEVGALLADPRRIGGLFHELVDDVKVTSAQLSATRSRASPLWSERSRQRHIEIFELPFQDARDAAKRLGGKLNDFFVAGALQGAARYHESRALPVDAFTVSFAIDTRRASTADMSTAAAANQFTIMPVELPAGRRRAQQHFRVVHERLAALKDEVHGNGVLNALSGAVNLLPTRVLTSSARGRAAHVDFVTSNAATAPFPLFMSGARVEAILPVGPAVGTAFNQTMLSYDGTLYVGMNIDTRAVDDPELLRRLMHDAYLELIASARGSRTHRK